MRARVLLLVFVAACKNDPAPTRDEPTPAAAPAKSRLSVEKSIDAAITAGPDGFESFKALRDRMCACKDAACAATVRTDWIEWAKSGVVQTVSDTQLDQMIPIERELGDCKAKLLKD